VRADRAFLALPKYVGFFEAFLKYEPAAATDMSADNPPSQRGSSSPCNSNGLRGQPGGDLSSGVRIGCLYINVFQNTIDTVRYVYSLYPEAAKLKDPGDGETILHLQRRAAVRKYSPGSRLLSREYISESCRSLCPYIHL
jgi:hypothetical protein